MTIPFNYSIDSTSRECAKTDTLSLKSVIMRTIDYPKARNRPQPAGSNRRVDLAMRPAAEGRICPGDAKGGQGRMERKNARRVGAREVGCASEKRAGAAGTPGKRSLRTRPVRHPLIEKRSSCEWLRTKAPVHFSRIHQRCYFTICVGYSSSDYSLSN